MALDMHCRLGRTGTSTGGSGGGGGEGDFRQSAGEEIFSDGVLWYKPK